MLAVRVAFKVQHHSCSSSACDLVRPFHLLVPTTAASAQQSSKAAQHTVLTHAADAADADAPALPFLLVFFPRSDISKLSVFNVLGVGAVMLLAAAAGLLGLTAVITGVAHAPPVGEANLRAEVLFRLTPSVHSFLAYQLGCCSAPRSSRGGTRVRKTTRPLLL